LKNPRIRNIQRKLLSDNWYSLERVTFDYKKEDGSWETHTREAYDRGNGAVILLYNASKKTVVLTKQFRMPTYLNGNATGMMIEACAGILENESAEACIKKEITEETGYVLTHVEKVFESYMSPGSVTEILHFFIGAYEDTMKTAKGGGAAEETEYIEVLEYPFETALQLIKTGEIKDAKTIMLLQYAQLQHLMA